MTDVITITDLMTLNVGDLFLVENVYNGNRQLFRVTHMDRENNQMSSTSVFFEEVGLLDKQPPVYYWREKIT